MIGGMTRFELMNEAERRALDSASDAVAVDAVNGDHEFGRCTRWIWTGTGDRILVRMASGKEVQFDGLAAGRMLPISVSAVLSAGTYASSVVAFF